MEAVEKLSDANLIAIFQYISLRDLARCSCVCKKWEKCIYNADQKLWKRHYHEGVPEDARRFSTAKEFFEKTGEKSMHRALLRAYLHSWKFGQKSENMDLHQRNPYVLHRKPVAQSSDLARASRGFTRGQHSWSVLWPTNPGSEALLGVATRDAALHSKGYVPLLGDSPCGWAWHLGKSQLMHNGRMAGSYPRNDTFGKQQGKFEPSNKVWITVNLDMDRGMLWFERKNCFLGSAFSNLPTSEPLYPAFSAVFGDTQVTMIYTGQPIYG